MTCADITNANIIFGLGLSGVWGETVRQKTGRVETEETYVPRYFYRVHKFLTLTAVVMFVNEVPFLVTLSQKIQLFTVEFIPSRTDAQLSIHLTKLVKLYARGGFSIRNF